MWKNKTWKKKGTKNTWINYDYLKEKWFQAPEMTFSLFLEKEWITKYSLNKTKWWVKEKKEYIKNKLKEKREETDKVIEEQLKITVNNLLKGKVKILETLLNRVDNITKLVDKKGYNWNLTQELININSVIKTELWEASNIQKVEWWWEGFSIMIIPKEKEKDK